MPPLTRIMDLVSLVTCKTVGDVIAPNGEMIVCDTCLVCYYFYTSMSLWIGPSNASNASNAAPVSHTRAYII